MLSQFLVSEIFAFFLVFCRLGAAFMLLPGFGEAYISVRVRLLMALMFSLAISPIIPNLPNLPEEVPNLAILLVAEILNGAFIGMIARILISAMQTAGAIIAYQTSLASALTQDMSTGQGQDSSISNMLSFSAVVMLFATDTHHMMLKGLVDSYQLFLPGSFPMMHDMANMATKTLTGAFRMAIQIAAPHLFIGLVIYIIAGIIARLMPNIQIFFIILPVQLALGFFIMMTVISAILIWYLSYFKDNFSAFISP